VHEWFDSDGLRLACHLVRPPGVARVPGLVLCHGFPQGPRGAATSALTYPDLADRLARDTGWAVMAFNLRGTGMSEGDFSLDGWLRDLGAAVDTIEERASVTGTWLCGSHTGGSLSICLAAQDDRVRGVATMGAPASFREWETNASKLLAHARQVGVIRTPGFPQDMQAWTRAFRDLDPLECAAKIPPRPLFVIHGRNDDVVPVSDALAFVGEALDSVDLRVLEGAGHRLRHDPRAIALLLGWMERQA
jgi:putative redox protein